MKNKYLFEDSICLRGAMSTLWDTITAPAAWAVAPKHPQTVTVATLVGEKYTDLNETPQLGDKFLEVTKSGPFKQEWIWEVDMYMEGPFDSGRGTHAFIQFVGKTRGIKATLLYEFKVDPTYEGLFTFTRTFTLWPTNGITRLAFPFFEKDINRSGEAYLTAIDTWWQSMPTTRSTK